MRLRMKAIGALAAWLICAPTAAAQFRVDSFYTEGYGVARWIETDTPAPGDSDRSVIELSVNTADKSLPDAARVTFTGVRGAPPASPPTYDFRPSVSGLSGGSPRMTMRLGNGGGELRPLSLTAGQWIHMDGLSNWDNYGGSCGYRADVTYSELLDCHPGEQVGSLEIWNDSDWLYPDGYRLLVDNITYGSERVSNQDVDALTGPRQAPVLGETVQVAPEAGIVRVRLPEGVGSGNLVPLSEVAEIPVGSVVDTRDGKVKLSSAVDAGSSLLHSGFFSRGQFRVVEGAMSGGDAGITELRLRGGTLGRCPRGNARAARFGRRMRSDVRRGRRSRLRARAAAPAAALKGAFRVRGRNSTATARGAAWMTVDRCDGTATRVIRGRLTLKDLRRRVTVKLEAGDRYLARTP
jgi:hypothetical protein